MRLILDIDDKILEQMQGYCKQKNTPLEGVVETLFTRFVQTPADIIDEAHARDGLEGYEYFRKVLHHYLNEAIYDIEVSSKSDEAYETDPAMAEVFKALSREYIDNAYIITGLYKEFERKMNNENDKG